MIVVTHESALASLQALGYYGHPDELGKLIACARNKKYIGIAEGEPEDDMYYILE